MIITLKKVLNVLSATFIFFQALTTPLIVNAEGKIEPKSSDPIELTSIIDNSIFDEIHVEDPKDMFNQEIVVEDSIVADEDSQIFNEPNEILEETITYESTDEGAVATSKSDTASQEDESSPIIYVENAEQLRAALMAQTDDQIQLVGPITLTQLTTVTYNKAIDLNGYELVINGSGELRFSGSNIDAFILKNGKISGTATTFIGDGNNGNPTVATNQLSNLKVYLTDLTAEGNNFYNSMTTSVFLSGDIRIQVRNTGFRVKNFSALAGSTVSIHSSGGSASGTTAQVNNTMQGVTMGNYATTGTEKVFFVEENAHVSIEVDAGGMYNNGIADFSHLEVYGDLSVDTWGTSLRSTVSYLARQYVYVNFYPDSIGYIRTRSQVTTGVLYTYPAIVTVDGPRKFDMIYYGNTRFFWPWVGGNVIGSGIRNSTISFLNMNIAAWTTSAQGVGTPALLDSNLTYLSISELNNTNTGTVSTDSTILQQFNPNNYSRISNDINMPVANPELSINDASQYLLTTDMESIQGQAQYVDTDNQVVANVPVDKAEIKLVINNKEFITTTDSEGFWTLPIDLSEINTETIGSLTITDESLRSNTVSVFVKEPEPLIGQVTVHYSSIEGEKLLASKVLEGIVGDTYETTLEEIEGWELVEIPENANGIFEETPIIVQYIYEQKLDYGPVSPVDPIQPELEVDPENMPELPENQGLLSIDFVSQFNFGSQPITIKESTYYARPQRLMQEDGTVNETEERPNYVQISDRRIGNDQQGWQLAVTQDEQFQGEEGQELTGAQLRFLNQDIVTAQDGIDPSLQSMNPVTLIPGNKQILLHAEEGEGTGTWVYRFGDSDTASKSIELNIPKGTHTEAIAYATKLIWELSSVPGN